MEKIKKLVSLIPQKKESLIGALGFICYGLLAVYALCMATPIATYVTFYEADFDDRPMSQYINSMNNLVLILCIFGLLLSALYFILRNTKRKKFYISNYIGTGIISAFSLFSSIMLFIFIGGYQTRYYSIDFEYINDYLSILPNVSISPTTSVFILGFLLAGAILIYASLLIYLMISRYLSSKKESELVSEEESSEDIIDSNLAEEKAGN